MSERAAFMAAICQTPADDTARLVFADWLEENGEPERAEFIRVGVTLAQVDMKVWQNADPKSDMCWSCWIRANGHEHLHRDAVKKFGCQCSGRVTQLRLRERELLTPENASCWADGFPFARMPGQGAVWRRGFITETPALGGSWAMHGDAARAQMPLERVTFTTVPYVNLILHTERYYVIGDPEQRGFTDAEIKAEVAAEVNREGVERVNGQWLRALCRLRWPGVEFAIIPTAPLGVPPVAEQSPSLSPA